MGNNTTVLLNQSDCEDGLSKLTTYVKEIAVQKTLTESYSLGDGYEGLFYDEMLVYLEAFNEVEGELCTMMKNYRSFIRNVVDGYAEVDNGTTKK